MKPYFAKYLQIEGSIGEGDLFFDLNGNVIECSRREGNIVYGPIKGFVDTVTLDEFSWSIMRNNGYERDRLVWKASLHICSRDIQVGDKVLVSMPYENGKLEEFTVVKKPEGYNLDLLTGIYSGNMDVNNPTYLHQNSFKVIGEISPEATWVKEGDEFDEEEILRDVLIKDTFDGVDGYIHLHPKGNEKIRELGSTEIFIEEYPIQIKGCCGHFH